MTKKKTTKKLDTYEAKHVALIAASIERNMPALLVGETGTGKTHLVREVAAHNSKELYRINLTGQTGVDEIVGKWLADTTRGTYWVDGLLTRAMREGAWVVLDEVNMALPEILAKLHSLLDDDRKIVLVEKEGETVRPHADFRLFATMNPSEEYAGTKELNRAFVSRFPIVLEMGESKKEADIIATRTGIDEANAVLLETFAKDIRKAKADGKLSFYVSTRDLISAAALHVAGVKLGEAVYTAVVAKAPASERDAIKKLADIMAGISETQKAEGAGLTLEELAKASTRMKELEKELAQAQKEAKENAEYKAKYDKIKTALGA